MTAKSFEKRYINGTIDHSELFSSLLTLTDINGQSLRRLSRLPNDLLRSIKSHVVMAKAATGVRWTTHVAVESSLIEANCN